MYVSSAKKQVSTDASRLDCIILGAGPAGLTALEYLARFHRNVLALGSAGPRPRLTLIERTYNLPGHPTGINGTDLLRRLREQASEMGGEVLPATATRVEGADGDFQIQTSARQLLRARKIILATGVRDREPDIPGIGPHVGQFLRYCPVCDGYEHTDQRLGIVGLGPAVARHALFLRTFSENITVFLHGAPVDCLEQNQEILERRGIVVKTARITGVLTADNSTPHEGCGVTLEGGEEIPLDVLYSAFGCHVNLEPVHPLGLKCDDEGYIITDCRQRTNVPGMYAAGDVVSQFNQICIAFGQGAVAAIDVHNALDQA